MRTKAVETILRYNMFGREARLGVAVSGGPDSVALLRVLHELAPEWNLRLWVLHLNHRIRGAESDEDAAFTAQLARELGLPAVIAADDPGARGGNLEQESRRARARFFAAARVEHGLDRIATGHTRSDQAETVLFRFLRGASTTGLAAILPVTVEGIVRPLLETGREDVLAHLAALGQSYREDSSNAGRTFRRNRIRHDLLPQLAREWNPAIVPVLANIARIAQDEDQYWGGVTAACLARCGSVHGRGMLLDKSLRAEPPAVVRRVFREAVRRVRGSLAGIDFHHIDRAVNVEYGGRVSLPGVEVWASPEEAFVGRPAPRGEFRVDPPCEVPELGVRLGLPDRGYTKEGHWLDGGKLGAPLTLRAWRPGDAYQPVGYGRVRKLKDLLQSSRVPSWDRAAWPIIHMDGRIVWAMRFGPAAGLEADPGTPRAVGVFVNLMGE